MIKWQIKFTVEEGTATELKKLILSFMYVMKNSELAVCYQAGKRVQL